MAPIKKPVWSKIGKSFEPVQLNRQNRLPPKGLDTCKTPLRRSTRLWEKNFDRKFDYGSISQRQSPKKAKIRENRRQGHLQLESKSPQTKKGKKVFSTKRKSWNQPQPLPISRQVQSDCKRPQTRDTQEIKQGVNQNKGNPIVNWLSTVPLSLQDLVDPLLQKPLKNMPSNPDPSLDASQILTQITLSAGKPSTGGGWALDFRDLLRKHNIFINYKDPSTKLVDRAKEIITKELYPEMDDVLAQELAVTAKNLETRNEQEIVMALGTKLFPARGEYHQSLQHTANNVWSNAAVIPPDPNVRVILPALPKPKPGLVYGYSEQAFDTNQLMILDFLTNQGIQNYAMPDGNVRFPFFVIEFTAQATGGSHFIATNEVANAGAVAMEGTLQLARRISAEEKIDFDEPQFFSISIDNAMAVINVHWLSRDAKNGAFCFHTEHLKWYFLEGDGLKAIDRAIKNILDYGVNERLAKIFGELDIYGERIAEMAIIDKGNLASDSLPEEQQQPQQRRPRKRKNADSFANRRQAPSSSLKKYCVQ